MANRNQHPYHSVTDHAWGSRNYAKHVLHVRPGEIQSTKTHAWTRLVKWKKAGDAKKRHVTLMSAFGCYVNERCHVWVNINTRGRGEIPPQYTAGGGCLLNNDITRRHGLSRIGFGRNTIPPSWHDETKLTVLLPGIPGPRLACLFVCSFVCWFVCWFVCLCACVCVCSFLCSKQNKSINQTNSHTRNTYN